MLGCFWLGSIVLIWLPRCEYPAPHEEIPIGMMGRVHVVETRGLTAWRVTEESRLAYERTGEQRTYVSIWGLVAGFAFTAFATMLLVGFCRHWRLQTIAREGWCDECGYDLTGSTSQKCPECGAPIG